MKQASAKENTTIFLHLSQEQYDMVKEMAEKSDVSVEGYALYKVLHEEVPIQPIPTPPMPERLLITPAEARELLGIGRTTMYKLIRDGIILTVKLPGCRKLFLSVDSLKQMIKNNTAFNAEIGGVSDE